MQNKLIFSHLLVLLFFITSNIFAQTITFSKIYNFETSSNFYSVQQTADSGYVAAGSIGRNSDDAFFLRTNNFGDTIWTKSYGYSYRDWVNEIQIAPDGGCIAAGRKNYHVDIEHGNMYGDIWILKLNSDGDTIWTKTYGGPANDYANSIKQTIDGGYIVACTKNIYCMNCPGDIWILKLNELGDTIWTKTIHVSSSLSEAKSIIQTNDSNFVFTGTGGVKKISNSGDSIWYKNFNSFVGNDLIETKDSNLVVVGFFNNSDDKIIKLDANGDIIWDYRERPYKGYYYKSNSLTLNESGEFMSVGRRINMNDVVNIPDDLYLMKRSSKGYSVLSNYYDLSIHDVANSVELANDNGFIIAGVTNQNGWLIKLDQNCELALNIDSVYNLISGDWYNTLNCSGFIGRCDSVYSDDLNQIERIEGTDSIVWKVFQKDKLAYQNKYKISYSYSNIYRTYKWMLTVGMGPKMLINSYQNKFSIGLDALDGGGYGYSRNKLTVGVFNNMEDRSEPLFFPNPTSTGFSVKGVVNIESIRIFDMNGKLVKTKASTSPELFDISDFPQGIYFVHVITKNRTFVGKIIKE
jgi:hypothetical protein